MHLSILNTHWIQYTQKNWVLTQRDAYFPADNGEQALEIANALVNSNAIDVLVVDSVAALVPGWN